MSAYAIREATDVDRDDVRALCAKLDPGDYVPAAWAEWRAGPDNRMLLAHAGGQLAGCVYAGLVAPGQVFSQALRVAAEHQRHGVATRLMDEQRRRLRARNIQVARGVTGLTNHRSRPFFATVGWNEIDIRRRRRLPDWRCGTRDTSERADIPDDLMVSIEGRAHFRRIYFMASRPWLDSIARAGRWHAMDGAWALVDPSSSGQDTWIVALGGPEAALRELLIDLSPPWRAAGGLTVEAPDDPSIGRVLDSLGFAPAAPEESYVVVECVL